MIGFCNNYFNRDKDYIWDKDLLNWWIHKVLVFSSMKSLAGVQLGVFFGMRIFPTWENSIFYMRNQKRSETILLQYCMFTILPILNFKDFSYCCNFEHNYPDNQKIRNCLSLSFTRRDRSTPYLQIKYFGTVQCSDFILKEPRKNDLKNNFYSMGKWF